MAIDPEQFIRTHLRIEPAAMVPEILLHVAHPASGLRQLREANAQTDSPPYWAYGWAGGTVLARHVLDQPEWVEGRRVLDIGCGSGIVAIAAARAGAAHVLACDIDRNALAATRVNAALNKVDIETAEGDPTETAPAAVDVDVDVVLVGDLFYDEATAATLLPWLQSRAVTGCSVLIGDPYRKHLPQGLSLVRDYDVPDFGTSSGGRAGVFRLP